MGQRWSMCISCEDESANSQSNSSISPTVPVSAFSANTGRQERPQGEVQKAFASQVEWEVVLSHMCSHQIVQDHYGALIKNMSPKDQKLVQVRTLLPLAKASYTAAPSGLIAKRSGVLNGYRDFAEKKGIAWRQDAARLEALGMPFWEKMRLSVRRTVAMPEYYRACYEGPLHSYDSGNGEWMAAFDAPSAYLLVHMHHFPDLAPQAAFDALHHELDALALKHLPSSGAIRVVDIGCGVGTSTFSTARSLQQLGRTAAVVGVDLSNYFIAVAMHLQELRADEFNETVRLRFMHGDGLDLASCGFEDSSAELVTISEVTHEMPRALSESLFVEATRVLAPGGVLAYMDLNPVQILKENSVGNLVDRIATSNEPYFDEYLELDVAGSMRASGLEVVQETWPNHEKYATLESCSLRIIVAKKPAALSLATWTGKWALLRRDNWAAYLRFLGVPEQAHEVASTSPDFHEYFFEESSFYMDHRIPTKGMHVMYTAFIDGSLNDNPYPTPTATMFDESGKKEEAKPSQVKHEWMDFPIALKTTMYNFVGKTVTLERLLVGIDEMKMTVHVLEPESGDLICGPCFTWMKRMSVEPPRTMAAELRERFASGISRPIEWRLAALDRVAAVALENIDAISAAQAEDRVSPSHFGGAAMMLRSAVAFYKASLASWAAGKPQESERVARRLGLQSASLVPPPTPHASAVPGPGRRTWPPTTRALGVVLAVALPWQLFGSQPRLLL